MKKKVFHFKNPARCLLTAFVILSLSLNGMGPVLPAAAQSLLDLPSPGTLVSVTPGYIPLLLKGLKLYPDNPFQFDFIMDTGQFAADGTALRDESAALIKYFLSALTIPEDELWVNLSPFEKERVIPDAFGETEMGRDLLAQDYLLKQLTASLMNPDEALGREFWDRVYQKAFELYGTTSIPVNTFNKIWIIPEEALVYADGDAVFILKSRLKVLLEQDYLATREVVDTSIGKALKLQNKQDALTKELRESTVDIVRDLLVPAIEQEVNEGKNFAKLRQIFHSVILAKWYKQNLKENILNKKYTDQRKIDGVDVEDKEIKEKIYQRYLTAFRKGVYNLIKEDYDSNEQKLIPRKYFLGGSSMKVTVRQTSDRRLLNDVPSANLIRVSSAVGLPSPAGIEKAAVPAVSSGVVNRALIQSHIDHIHGLLDKYGTSSVNAWQPQDQASDFDLIKASPELGAMWFMFYLLNDIQNYGKITLTAGPVNNFLSRYAEDSEKRQRAERYMQGFKLNEDKSALLSRDLGVSLSVRDERFAWLEGTDINPTGEAISSPVPGRDFTRAPFGDKVSAEEIVMGEFLTDLDGLLEEMLSRADAIRRVASRAELLPATAQEYDAQLSDLWIKILQRVGGFLNAEGIKYDMRYQQAIAEGLSYQSIAEPIYTIKSFARPKTGLVNRQKMEAAVDALTGVLEQMKGQVRALGNDLNRGQFSKTPAAISRADVILAQLQSGLDYVTAVRGLLSALLAKTRLLEDLLDQDLPLWAGVVNLGDQIAADYERLKQLGDGINPSRLSDGLFIYEPDVEAARNFELLNAVMLSLSRALKDQKQMNPAFTRDVLTALKQTAETLENENFDFEKKLLDSQAWFSRKNNIPPVSSPVTRPSFAEPVTLERQEARALELLGEWELVFKAIEEDVRSKERIWKDASPMPSVVKSFYRQMSEAAARIQQSAQQAKADGVLGAHIFFKRDLARRLYLPELAGLLDAAPGTPGRGEVVPVLLDTIEKARQRLAQYKSNFAEGRFRPGYLAELEESTRSGMAQLAPEDSAFLRGLDNDLDRLPAAGPFSLALARALDDLETRGLFTLAADIRAARNNGRVVLGPFVKDITRMTRDSREYFLISERGLTQETGEALGRETLALMNREVLAGTERLAQKLKGLSAKARDASQMTPEIQEEVVDLLQENRRWGALLTLVLGDAYVQAAPAVAQAFVNLSKTAMAVEKLLSFKTPQDIVKHTKIVTDYLDAFVFPAYASPDVLSSDDYLKTALELNARPRSLKRALALRGRRENGLDISEADAGLLDLLRQAGALKPAVMPSNDAEDALKYLAGLGEAELVRQIYGLILQGKGYVGPFERMVFILDGAVYISNSPRVLDALQGERFSPKELFSEFLEQAPALLSDMSRELGVLGMLIANLQPGPESTKKRVETAYYNLVALFETLDGMRNELLNDAAVHKEARLAREYVLDRFDFGVLDYYLDQIAPLVFRGKDMDLAVLREDMARGQEALSQNIKKYQAAIAELNTRLDGFISPSGTTAGVNTPGEVSSPVSGPSGSQADMAVQNAVQEFTERVRSFIKIARFEAKGMESWEGSVPLPKTVSALFRALDGYYEEMFQAEVALLNAPYVEGNRKLIDAINFIEVLIFSDREQIRTWRHAVETSQRASQADLSRQKVAIEERFSALESALTEFEESAAAGIYKEDGPLLAAVPKELAAEFIRQARQALDDIESRTRELHRAMTGAVVLEPALLAEYKNLQTLYQQLGQAKQQLLKNPALRPFEGAVRLLRRNMNFDVLAFYLMDMSRAVQQPLTMTLKERKAKIIANLDIMLNALPRLQEEVSGFETEVGAGLLDGADGAPAPVSSAVTAAFEHESREMSAQREQVLSLIPQAVSEREEAADYIVSVFGSAWPEALSMMGKHLFDPARRDFIGRMVKAGLSIEVMSDLLFYESEVRNLRLESFPEEFVAFVLENSKSRRGFHRLQIDDLWGLYAQYAAMQGRPFGGIHAQEAADLAATRNKKYRAALDAVLAEAQGRSPAPSLKGVMTAALARVTEPSPGQLEDYHFPWPYVGFYQMGRFKTPHLFVALPQLQSVGPQQQEKIAFSVSRYRGIYRNEESFNLWVTDPELIRVLSPYATDNIYRKDPEEPIILGSLGYDYVPGQDGQTAARVAFSQVWLRLSDRLPAEIRENPVLRSAAEIMEEAFEVYQRQRGTRTLQRDIGARLLMEDTMHPIHRNTAQRLNDDAISRGYRVVKSEYGDRAGNVATRLPLWFFEKVLSEGASFAGGPVSSPLPFKPGPENIAGAEPEAFLREGFASLGGVRYSNADIAGVVYQVRDAWLSRNPDSIRTMKNRVITAIRQSLNELTAAMVDEILIFAQQDTVSEKTRSALRNDVATAFAMAVENAIDSYYLKKTLDEDYKGELTAAAFMRKEDGVLIFQLVTNGLSLEEFSAVKSGAAQVTRLGGLGEGLAVAKVSAFNWKSEVKLLDRMGQLGDENGAVFELRMPKQGLQEAFVYYSKITSSSPVASGLGNREEVGGIDFNPAYLDIRTQGRGIDIPYSASPGALDQIDIPGLTPFIFNIAPVYSLPFILGVNEAPRQEFLSRR